MFLAGNYGLPQQGGEQGLPGGELFEIIPIPGNGSADLLIEIKVLASIGMCLPAQTCLTCALQLSLLSSHNISHDCGALRTVHRMPFLRAVSVYSSLSALKIAHWPAAVLLDSAHRTVIPAPCARAEIVVESCENDAEVYRQVAEDWKLLPNVQESAWHFMDHITKNEHALLRCTGLSRFRITAPMGVNSTFNVLRPKRSSQVPDSPSFSDGQDWLDSETDPEAEDVPVSIGRPPGGRFVATKCVNLIRAPDIGCCL